MFVVFEGIDGSGKTTISNRVAKALRRRGIEVEHIREGGEFASPLVSRMREFGKDPRNMAMAPLTELLFYVARDAQLLAECIRPALKRGGLVFADRYLYSYEVLSHFGRGLPMSQIRPVLDAVADGMWPDLVVLMDVDPYVARARRKVSKLAKKATSGKPEGGGSRKGLQGVGTQHRLQAGYRTLAERDPRRWLVVDNADPLSPDGHLDAIVERITDAIERMWQGQGIPEVIEQTQVPGAPPIAAVRPDFAAGWEAFYRAVEARGTREVPVAAYFLAGLSDDRAHDLRERWAEEAPDTIAYGLRGLDDERAWAMRERLADVAPYFVARSLDGNGVAGERVDAMRERFVDREPQAVLGTLTGNDSAAAWDIRDRLTEHCLPDVVASLKRIDSARAWALRERLESESSAVEALDALIASVSGLADERAWAIRERYLERLPSQVLESLASVHDARSWGLRSCYASQAPKIVLRTIDEADDPRAWALRRVYAPRVKEALDSMVGLDSEVAWTIRTECLEIWPSTTIKSLGPLAESERGQAMALLALERYPDNISLLKHITRLATQGSKSRYDLEKAG